MTTNDEFVVVTVSGTGEPAVEPGGLPQGMLGLLCSNLNSRFHCGQLNWNNSYGPVGGQLDDRGYRFNVDQGVELLSTYLDKHVGWPIVLMGYSAGAHVVSKAAPLLEHDHDIRAVVTVANPIRRRGDSDKPWWGIAGERELLKGNTKWIDVANDKDVIPCCPEHQPLRDFAGLTQDFCFVDPIKWGHNALNYVTNGMLNGAFASTGATPMDWWLSLAYMRGYLFDGQHTTYYVNRMPQVAHQLMRTLDAL